MASHYSFFKFLLNVLATKTPSEKEKAAEAVQERQRLKRARLREENRVAQEKADATKAMIDSYDTFIAPKVRFVKGDLLALKDSTVPKVTIMVRYLPVPVITPGPAPVVVNDGGRKVPELFSAPRGVVLDMQCLMESDNPSEPLVVQLLSSSNYTKTGHIDDFRQKEPVT